MPRSPLKIFLIRFTLLFVILNVPWPGFHDADSACFRAFGSMVFTGTPERSQITFEAPESCSPRPHDTRVVIVNNALINNDGSGPVRNLDFDAIAIGWRPLALLVTLIVSTPLPWRRRVRALVFGTLGLHAFFLVFLGVAIWNESTEVSLVTLTPFWKSALNGFRTMFTSQLGLCLPVLIWGLVTFRRNDKLGIIARFTPLPANRKESDNDGMGVRSSI